MCRFLSPYICVFFILIICLTFSNFPISVVSFSLCFYLCFRHSLSLSSSHHHTHTHISTFHSLIFMPLICIRYSPFLSVTLRYTHSMLLYSCFIQFLFVLSLPFSLSHKFSRHFSSPHTHTYSIHFASRHPFFFKFRIKATFVILSPTQHLQDGIIQLCARLPLLEQRRKQEESVTACLTAVNNTRHRIPGTASGEQ